MSLATAYAIQKKNKGSSKMNCYAQGGEVEMKKPMSMVDAIMQKRLMAKHMASGGMIENDNQEDEMDMDEAHNLEMVDGLEDHNDFLSDAPQMPEMDDEENMKMKRSKMLGGILSRVRYGK